MTESQKEEIRAAFTLMMHKAEDFDFQLTRTRHRFTLHGSIAHKYAEDAKKAASEADNMVAWCNETARAYTKFAQSMREFAKMHNFGKETPRHE